MNGHAGGAHSASPKWSLSLIGSEVVVGLTVALVAIPQCIGFASIAGLPPESGVISAVAMGLVSAVASRSPRLVIGPAITASTMLLSVLRTVAPGDSGRWLSIASLLAVLVGLMTVGGMLIGIGRLVHFVSRSVIVGLVVGSVLLTIGSQLAAVLGVSPGTDSMLFGMLYHTGTRISEANLISITMAAGVFLMVMVGAKLGPRFPAAFASLVISGAVAWALESRGIYGNFRTLGSLHWDESIGVNFSFRGLSVTNLLAGAAAITLVGIIQNLAIGKAIVTRTGEAFDARKELAALGLANVAAGFAKGFPGSASFARSALADLAGARTRLATLVTAVATGLIAVAAAPLARYVTAPAIGGLLVATACSMIDWTELGALIRDAHDRPILITMIVCVFILPIHWAILIGLVVSLVLLLRRVSRVHLFEMVRTEEGPFREQEIDDKTGRSAITMVQLEGPLFFAHADLLASRLREIFRRGTRVTIVRMRRTQHIDFSILAALRQPVREYLDQGGHLIFCGLTPQMRATIQNSLLGEILGPDSLLETTREVFGSAHVAIGRAQEIVAAEPEPDRELFRVRQGVVEASPYAHADSLV